MESVFLRALHAEPADLTARLALADWLEEQGRDGQAELTRLHARQLQGVGTLKELTRINALLRARVSPVVPEVAGPFGMRFALIPPGTYHTQTGSVTISRPFYLGVHPVTQAQYTAATGESPFHFSSRRAECASVDVGELAAESVNWEEAAEFCTRLSKRHKGRRYRLPTEGEWERACRAGAAHLQKFHTGKSLGRQANYDGKYGGRKGLYLKRTSAVGEYPPNAFGLYDMHGNVWEWCADWFGSRPPEGVDPTGPRSGRERATRGGCWDGLATACWTDYRIGHAPTYRNYHQGLRVALDWPAGDK